MSSQQISLLCRRCYNLKVLFTHSWVVHASMNHTLYSTPSVNTHWIRFNKHFIRFYQNQARYFLKNQVVWFKKQKTSLAWPDIQIMFIHLQSAEMIRTMKMIWYDAQWSQCGCLYSMWSNTPMFWIQWNLVYVSKEGKILLERSKLFSASEFCIDGQVEWQLFRIRVLPKPKARRLFEHGNHKHSPKE